MERGLKEAIVIEFVAKLPGGHEYIEGNWVVPPGNPAVVLPDRMSSESLGNSIRLAFMDGANEIIVKKTG